MQFRSRHIAVIALSLTAFAACSSDLPTPAAPTFSALESSASTAKTEAPRVKGADVLKVKTKVNPLHRATKLDKPESVSMTIGATGGTLSLRTAGATLTVPAGAVLTPVTITMTALPGDAVSYEFAPHGLVFLKPLTLTQKLEGTKEKGKTGTSRDAVELGYFALPTQVTSLLAELEELRSGTETAGTFSAPIWHFSGYALGCGRR